MIDTETNELFLKAKNKYDEHNQYVLRTLPLYAIQAFLPQHWRLSGFPTNVSNISELKRVHDFDVVNYLELLAICGQPISSSEKEVIVNIAKEMLVFSKKYFGIKSIARKGLLNSLHYFRLLAQRTKDLEEVKLLELGPGCGYLGIISNLINKKYRYLGVEITQQLWIYQELLWNHFTSIICSFKNTKSSYFTDNKFNKLPSHLEYSLFPKLDSELPVPEVVISNHCMGEMSERALICYAKRILLNWRNNGINNGRWIAQGLGSPEITGHPKIIKIMNDIGYELIEITRSYSKFGNVLVWRDSKSEPLYWEKDLVKNNGEPIDLDQEKFVDYNLKVKEGRNLLESYGRVNSFPLLEDQITVNLAESEFYKIFNKINPSEEHLDDQWFDFVSKIGI